MIKTNHQQSLTTDSNDLNVSDHPKRKQDSPMWGIIPHYIYMYKFPTFQLSTNLQLKL